MTSLLQVQANRLNALKSTGPRSLAGKDRSSLNSVKHGLRTWKPVLLPHESLAEWKKFARPILESLQPVGPVEVMWAGRAALLMWRLHRSADARKTLVDQQWREAEALAPESAWWQHRQKTGNPLPTSLHGIREALAESTMAQALLRRVAAIPATHGPEADRAADPDAATELISWTAGHLGVEPQFEAMFFDRKYPGLGALTEDPDASRYEWSLGMVRKSMEEVAGWKQTTWDDLLATLIPAMRQAHRSMRARQRRAQRELHRFRHCSAARSPETFRKYDRYEAMLERTIARALSQLRLLQAQRQADSSPNVAPTSPNVVRVGFAAVEIQENSPNLGSLGANDAPDPRPF